MPKNWIGNALLAIALTAPVAVMIAIGRHVGLKDTSEWAAWVQAIGSIAAIFGAAWLTQRQIDAQAKIALDAETRELKRANDALLAVVDGAARQFLKLEPVMDVGSSEDFSHLNLLFHYREQSFTDAINALETVRLLDLGSYDLVEAVAGMKAGMIDLRHVVREAMNDARGREEQPDHQIKDYGESVIDRLKRHYGKAAEILGGKPILAHTWMDD